MGLALTWVGLATWEVVVVVNDGGGGGNEVGWWWWEEGTDESVVVERPAGFGHRQAAMSEGHTSHANGLQGPCAIEIYIYWVEFHVLPVFTLIGI